MDNNQLIPDKEFDEKDLEYKNDYELGEGANYTGQMMKMRDETTNQTVFIKHGKGT